MTAALVIWAALSAVDNGRGITVAHANYWIAYQTTFVARERVKVASTDYVRIHEYQEAALRTAGLRRIQDRPCPNGEQVDVYYLCPSN